MNKHFEKHLSELNAKVIELKSACENVLGDPTLFLLMQRSQAQSLGLTIGVARYLEDRLSKAYVEEVNIDKDPDWIKPRNRSGTLPNECFDHDWSEPDPSSICRKCGAVR
jgi:hypothetical protein